MILRLQIYLDFLLSVDSISWNQILGGKDVFFALGNVNTAVSVWLDNDLGSTFGTSTATTASSASTAATSSAATTTSASAWRFSESASTAT